MNYLASPYSHPDPLIMKTRFLLAEQALAKLLLQRIWTYSPIVHHHEVALKYNLSRDWETFWKPLDFDMLRRCNRLLILAIPGWRESQGVTTEIKFAREASIPISLYNDREEIVDFVFEEI